MLSHVVSSRTRSKLRGSAMGRGAHGGNRPGRRVSMPSLLTGPRHLSVWVLAERKGAVASLNARSAVGSLGRVSTSTALSLFWPPGAPRRLTRRGRVHECCEQAKLSGITSCAPAVGTGDHPWRGLVGVNVHGSICIYNDRLARLAAVREPGTARAWVQCRKRVANARTVLVPACTRARSAGVCVCHGREACAVRV